MKKLLPFFGALTLMLISCSSDDSKNDSNDVALLIKPSRITYLVGTNELNYFVDYKYDGNKIVSETEDNGHTTKYIYTGDLITKKEVFDKQLVYSTEYTYTNGKLSSSITKYVNSTSKNLVSDYYDKIIYTYNTDNTVYYEKITVNSTDGTEQKSGSLGTLTFKDGNLIKSVVRVNYGMPATVTYSNEFDIKNNPLKNITGRALLINDYASANNLTKNSGTTVYDKEMELSSHSAKRKSSASNEYIGTYTYTYDSKDFPIEVKSFDTDGVLYETVKYTY